jgi:hypothetical protein
MPKASDWSGAEAVLIVIWKTFRTSSASIIPKRNAGIGTRRRVMVEEYLPLKVGV